MKSLVVMTYYQLMHSIALALTFDEKPNLYFSMSYIDPPEELLTRIEETGVFNKVVGITRRGEFTDFLIELRKTKGLSDEEIDRIGSSLFDKYLIPLYEESFKDSDKNDEIYIYNDFQWHYYYIAKNFDNIIGVEDGYKSLLQQTKIHRYKGDHTNLLPFIRAGYHPEPLYRCPKVQKIISSAYFDELDDYYKEKLEIRDFVDIVMENRQKFRDALLHIFDLDGFVIEDNSVIYLEQPLDRAKYCDSMQSYLLNKKYIRRELDQGYKVVMKPHPAESLDCRIFNDNNVTVLPQAFPIEILNYQDNKFEKLIAFSSTGALTTTCAKEQINFFEGGSGDVNDVKKFIKDEIKDENIVIDVYVRVVDTTPQDYINVYSTIFRHKKIKTRLHIIAPDERIDEYEEYFAPERLDELIKEFRAANREAKERAMWHSELRWMKNWIKRYDPVIDFCPITYDLHDDRSFFSQYIKDAEGYDYLILLDEENTAFNMTEAVIKELKFRMKPAIYFKSYTNIYQKGIRKMKLSLNPGYLYDHFGSGFSNILWHNAVINSIPGDNMDTLSFERVINNYSGSITRKSSIALYSSSDRYDLIEDGKEYYSEYIRKVRAKYPDDPEYIAGSIALTAYDFYDWQQIKGKGVKTDIDQFIDDNIEDPELRTLTYKYLANGLLFEKSKNDKSIIFQQNDFYYSLQSAVETSAKSGALSRAEDLKKVKDRIFGKKAKK